MFGVIPLLIIGRWNVYGCKNVIRGNYESLF